MVDLTVRILDSTQTHFICIYVNNLKNLWQILNSLNYAVKPLYHNKKDLSLL